VDVVNATYADTTGSAELIATWTDSDFDPALDAFYYARALAIPTPRWTTIQARDLGVPPPEMVASTVQERAWSSPIWYAPTSEARAKADAGRSVADLEKAGAVALTDAELRDLITAKFLWLKNTVTGGIVKTQWTDDGLVLFMNVDPRIPQPSEFGDLEANSFLGDANSAYSIADGKIVTNFGNRDYSYTVYKLDGAATGDTSGADAAKPTYVLARSNEFGYANYEVVEAPIFLGTEITDAVVPQ
jgi:hypothetical protein